MANLYASSKIVFNCSLNKDINMRLFEGCCSGSLVIADLIPDLPEFDIPVPTYKDDKELVEKIKYYLVNEKERQSLAFQCRQKVIAKHTYVHRMKYLVDIVKELI